MGHPPGLVARIFDMKIGKYLDASEKLDLSGLDWELARRVGLTTEERFVLTYFADVESQTILYMRDLLHTRTALEPDVIAFLSMWNYEECFHGRAIAQLLAECGYPLGGSRAAQVRGAARLREKVEALGGALLSRLFGEAFPAVYFSWGAINELTTLRGYERIIATTRNPVVAELCRRIAKQERRHFAYYFNSARERLAASRGAQRLTRWVLTRFWSPVGAGVKRDEEVALLLRSLFPGSLAAGLAAEVDGRTDTLPGLCGMRLMGRFADALSYAGEPQPTRPPQLQAA
jgi:rubrerythrin